MKMDTQAASSILQDIERQLGSVLLCLETPYNKKAIQCILESMKRLEEANKALKEEISSNHNFD